MSSQDEDIIKRLLALSQNDQLNGEQKERRRWRFNGEFNLGHVFTILSIIGGATLFWSTSQLKQQDHEFRIVALERIAIDFKQEMAKTSAQNSETIAKITETQNQATLNQQRIITTLDFLVKQPK